MAGRSGRLVSGEVGLLLRRGAPEMRLEELAKEHERLLREIRKKRQQVAAAEQLRSELHTRLAGSLEPAQRQIRELVTECHALFERVLATESVSRRNRSKLREIYGAFSEDFGAEATLQTQAERSSGEQAHNQRSQQPSRTAGYAAHKPDVEQAATLHGIFRRLVNAVHPDKVQAAAEKDVRTALLKEVTRAYETLDLARLVELERIHLAQSPVVRDVNQLSRRTSELVAANAELRRQAKAVASELRTLKRALPAEFDTAAVSPSEVVTMSLAPLLASLHRQRELLQVTCALLRQLEAGKLGALAFLDSSWRATPEVDPLHGGITTEPTGAMQTPVTEVNEGNVEGVLNAFKQRLRESRSEKK